MKLKPNLYVPPVENPSMKKSKFVGYCEACDLMLSALDKVEAGYKCPGCGKLNKQPAKSRKKSAAWA